MASNGHLLEIVDLHVQREEREILRGVDLILERGSVHAVLGLNGSGKSTLAYTLMGSAGYAPCQGRILFEGQEITGRSISERGKLGITLAWQEPARFEGITVGSYLSLGVVPDFGSLLDFQSLGRVEAALEAVSLTRDYLGRYVDASLSGGERKRVELAAVYAMQPKLAILDEPDSGIDILTLDDIGRLIHLMAREGTAVMLISHRNEIVQIADKASLICEGRILQTGAPERVCDRYARCCQPCERSERVELETEYERL